MPDAIEIKSQLRGAYAPRHHARAAPSTGIFDAPAAIPAINADWIPHIIGALSLLEADDAWLGDDETRFTAIQEIEKLIEWLMSLRKAGGMTIGSVVGWSGTIENAPENWLICDGQTYNRVDYPALYDAIHPDLQIDEDTFRVPDIRARSITGAGVWDDHDTIYVEVGQHEAFGYDSNLPDHYHLIPTIVVGLTDGATNRRVVKDSFAGAEAQQTSGAGGFAYRSNYPPSYGLYQFIVAS